MSRKCQHTWIDDESKRHFDLERAPKGIIPNKYRPITYLPYVENLNCTNKKRNMLLACMPWTISEGFLKGKRGTDDLLNIVQHILNKVKRRRKNVAITSIYNKNSLWTWKIEFLKMLKICHKGINIITKAMESWTVELAVEGKTLTEIKIQRCDFQWDFISPLLLVIMLLNLMPRKCIGGNKLTKSQGKK